ncbi:MAG: MHYT domain-containing protein [Trueperaceae bacterium]
MHDHALHVTWSSWNYLSVLISFLFASFGAFASLEMAINLQKARGFTARSFWLVMASLCLGGAIWTMHYIGMNAYKSEMDMSYNLVLTLASVAIAVVAAGIAFTFVARPKVTLWQMALGGLIAGLGVAGMHYTGMASMIMPADISYDTTLFALSIVIAVVVSTVAIWIYVQIGRLSKRGMRGFKLIALEIAAALVMGVAVCSMHYTGMAATIFTPTNELIYTVGLDGSATEFLVVTSSFVLFIGAIMASMFARGVIEEAPSAELTTF